MRRDLGLVLERVFEALEVEAGHERQGLHRQLLRRLLGAAARATVELGLGAEVLGAGEALEALDERAGRHVVGVLHRPGTDVQRNVPERVDLRRHASNEAKGEKNTITLILNGSSVLPYITRPPPRPGNPSWSSRRFSRLIAHNF